MTLQEIRSRKAAKVAEARAIVAAAETATRSLTADESAKFDAIKAEITDLEAQETRASFLADQERSMHGEPVHGDSRGNLESRVSLLKVLQAQMEGRSLTGAEAEYHAEAERTAGRKVTGILVPLSALESRAANTTTTAADLVGTDHRGDQYIGPLRDSLLIRQMGIRVLSGLQGNVSIPKANTGLSAGWVVEGDPITESNMTFDAVTMTPKHVGAIAELSRQLIQQSDPSIERLVREDISHAIAAEIDRAIVAGSGLLGQPTGIVNLAGVQTATALPADWQDVLAMEQQLHALNINPTGWYTTPGVLSTLRGTLKEAGLPGYISEGGNIGNLPAHSSNAAPAATAILGDWSQVLLGQWGGVEILANAFAEGPYRRGAVLVRAMMTCDVAVRHEEAFVVAPDATP